MASLLSELMLYSMLILLERMFVLGALRYSPTWLLIVQQNGVDFQLTGWMS